MPAQQIDHSTMKKLYCTALPLILTSALLLSACGGGSSGPAPTGSDDGGSTGTADGGNTGTGDGGTDSTDGTTDGNNTAGDGGSSSSLSHVGTPASVNTVDPTKTAFFSARGRDKAAAMPNNLAVVFDVVENHGGDAFPNGTTPTCSSLGAQYSSCSIANLHIKDATGLLNDGNWKLYFHSIRRVLRVDSDEFTVSHVNGDLNYVEPSAGFTGFSGDVKTIALVMEYNYLIESDFMPRYWLARGSDVTVIENTNDDTDESQYATAISAENRRSFNGEPIALATASSRFTKNSDVETVAATLSPADIQSRIIPRPSDVRLGTGTLDIGSGFSFAGTQLAAPAIIALSARQAQFMSTSAGVPLSATINASLGANGYTLEVTSTGISLTGADEQALYYAAQSLLSLVQPGVGTIPTMSVSDAPRLDYRGMHVDVARNFHSVSSLQRLIDQMAAYKLNKLHIHLSDDEGWRLEIPSLPELTTIGARRSFQLDAAGNVNESGGLMPQLGSGPTTSNQGTGFYTRNDFIALLRYAADRYIQVIPEFDMPAHARAAVVAMRVRATNLGDANDINVRLDDPQDTSRYLTIQSYNDGILNPCLPGTYNFIETVIADVQSMYTAASVTLDTWHMGGDEANNVFTGGGFQDVNAGSKVPWRGEITRSDWDYPWEASPACASFIANTPGIFSRDDLQLYFVKQVAQRVADAGISTLYAYQDIYDLINANELATLNAGVGYWEPISTAAGYNNINGFSNRGFETLVAVPDFLYFDFPQEVDPEERGYYWATRYTDTRKVFGFAPENLPQNAETSVNKEGASWTAAGNSANQGIVGIQGQLWSETVRTPEQFDYMVYPRLLALAERAWSKGSWELDYVPGTTFSGSTNLVDKNARTADYAGFAAALGHKELKKLDAAGIRYRVSVPGASVSGGQLVMNSDLPGLPLEYSTNGSTFVPYTGTTSSNGVVAIRARSSDGNRTGRADSVE
ncbi:MAG: hexosaminidase [Porticoccaceae bacterium]|jgi:hexosaminidase